MIPNPLELGKRVNIKTSKETVIYCCAKKISAVPEVFALQQSDYENIVWKKETHENITSNCSKIASYIKKFIRHVISAITTKLSAISAKKPEELKLTKTVT